MNIGCSMTDNTEALRLADELTAAIGAQSTYSAMHQAAAELRRLHALNAELVKALRAIAAMSPYSNDAMEAIVRADGALAKVEASNGS